MTIGGKVACHDSINAPILCPKGEEVYVLRKGLYEEAQLDEMLTSFRVATHQRCKKWIISFSVCKWLPGRTGIDGKPSRAYRVNTQLWSTIWIRLNFKAGPSGVEPETAGSLRVLKSPVLYLAELRAHFRHRLGRRLIYFIHLPWSYFAGQSKHFNCLTKGLDCAPG